MFLSRHIDNEFFIAGNMSLICMLEIVSGPAAKLGLDLLKYYSLREIFFFLYLILETLGFGTG